MRTIIAASLMMGLMLGGSFSLSAGADPGKVEESALSKELRKQAERDKAPIKTRADLEANLQDPDSPLYALTPHSLDMFVESLQFGDKGVGAFRRTELENELTPTQILDVLELFGFQQAIAGFQNARVETQKDMYLLKRGGNDPEIQMSPCGTYVEGYCVAKGTCQLTNGYCCDPGACSDY